VEAFLYEKLDNKKVRCNLCSHRCIIKSGMRGICGVRENRSGILETLVYHNVIARHVDPIEKKPLFHVAPGSLSYSIATIGCNLKCRFCQNADIAHFPIENRISIPGENITPKDIVDDALRNNCRTIAYTYTEPTVYFELALETAKLAKKMGLKNVFVTNGFMTQEAISMIAPFLDAANVDLKAFHDDFYKTQCSARIEPVKEGLIHMKSCGIFIEVTTLLIPGLNDNPNEIERLASFIVHSIGEETPWHISRFHPTYKLTDRKSTPVQSIIDARETGIKAGLKYVYTGNIPGAEGESTFCYNCKKLLIDRHGYTINKNIIKNSRCPFCNALIDGIDL